MIKIGILTYHASHNIGSMLQSYALQVYLEQTHDCEVEFIDYSSPEQRNMYALFPKKKRTGLVSKMKGIVRLIIDLLFYPILKKRFEDFEDFKNNHLKLSQNNYTYSHEINELEDHYDYIFIGSDQIWNVNCRDFTNVYFVDFKTKATLIAYAPSLGGKNILKSSADIRQIKNLIERMDHISVREVNGKKWLEELTNREFEVVADPTLLVHKEQWRSFVNSYKSDFEYDDYIFFYGQAFSEQTFPTIEKISKKLGKKIVMLDARSWLYNFCFTRGFVLEKRCSPLDYLTLIKNASLVITTSYHGTIFSTVFEKDFWTATFRETNPDDDRVITLLKQLGLQDRFIFLEDAMEINLSEKVDYSRYDKSLEPLLSNSIHFINKSLADV